MDVVSLLLLFAILIIIMLLANFAERERQRGVAAAGWLLLAYGGAASLYLILFFFGIGAQAAGVLLLDRGVNAAQVALWQQIGLDPALIQTLPQRLPVIAFGLWFPSLLGLFLLLPPVRRLVMRLTPLDPANHVHAIALALTMVIPINLIVTLGIGLETLATTLASSAEAGVSVNMLPSLWVQQLLTILLAWVGVGWWTRRSWRDVVARLKLERPTRAQVGRALLVGLVLVPVVAGLELLGERLGWSNAAVNDLSEQLLGPLLTSIPGILTVGLAAALGEETLFRGALQPRFGRILTALLFALLHSTYGLSLATVAVFILGYILGLVRDRYNTSASMVVHAAYNLTLGIISFFGAGTF